MIKCFTEKMIRSRPQLLHTDLTVAERSIREAQCIFPLEIMIIFMRNALKTGCLIHTARL